MADKVRYSQLQQSEPELFTRVSTDGIRLLTGEREVDEAEAAKASQLAKVGLPAAWASTGVVSEDQYFLFLRDAVQFSNGKLGTYVRMVSRPPGVMGAAALCVRAGEVFLVRQFRHATRCWHEEVPRGFGEAGESCEQTARREIEEELGIRVAHLKSLGLLHPNSGILSETVALFLAEMTNTATGAPPEHEVVRVSLASFEAKIKDATLTDAFTLAVFARARSAGML